MGVEGGAYRVLIQSRANTIGMWYDKLQLILIAEYHGIKGLYYNSKYKIK